MQPLSMKRIMLLSVIGRAIQEIEADPKRGLRRVVDLGQDLLHGDTAQEIFLFLQELVHKQNSSCYTLLERMVREVDHKTLQHFCVALGWDSWTEGGKLLRQSAHQQSWARDLTVTASDTARTLRTEIRADIAKGVRTFVVRADSQAALDTALQLASSASTCAVVLMVPPALINNRSAARISLCHTVCTVLYDTADCAKAQAILRRAKCLYGVYHVCTEQDSAASITDWLAQLNAPYFAIVHEGKSPKAQEIAQKIVAFRKNPTLPILPIAAQADFARIQARIDCKRTG